MLHLSRKTNQPGNALIFIEEFVLTTGPHLPGDFALTQSDSHLWQRYHRQHRQVLAAVADAKPDLARYSPQAVAQGRRSWALMAVNEYRAVATMAQVAHAMALAQAPLDLTHAACQFPGQELHHAHLCALLATALGGPQRMHAPQARPTPHLPQAVADAVRYAHTLVVTHLCVAETISFALLKAALADAHNGFATDVLKVLCKDEALHAELGWAYLDWAADVLTDQDRLNLARIATAAVAGYRAVWQPTLDSGPPADEHDRFSLSLLTPSRQAQVGEQAVDEHVRPALTDYGIIV